MAAKTATAAATRRGHRQPAAFQLFLLLPVLLLPATTINCDIGIELGSQRQQQQQQRQELGAAAFASNNDSPSNLDLDEELDNSIPTTTKQQQHQADVERPKPDLLEPIERRLDRLEFELRKSIHHQLLAGPSLASDTSAAAAEQATPPTPPGNSSDASNSSAIREQLANGETKWSSLASRLALVEKFITITTSKLYETEQKVRQLERCDCRQSCKWRAPGANATGAMVTKSDGDVWSHQCDLCSCHRGHVRCSHQLCPEPQCSEPQHLPGKCCPVCYKQCLYKSQTVRHGNKLVINSSQDTCKECMCIDGRLKCQRVAASLAASASAARGRRRATPLDTASDYYEAADEEEPDVDAVDELEGLEEEDGGAGSRGKRHSLSAAGQHPDHAHLPPLVCPPVDCPPDKQFRILDDCCTYCQGHDFCRQQARRLCHPQARCDNLLHHQASALEVPRPIWPLSSMFQCKCRPGFEGDGASCLDIDECAEWNWNECDLKTTNCHNLAGGYQCRCKRGFRPPLEQQNGSDSGRPVRQCLDVNECADGKLNRCHPQAKCINLAGSYRCQCKRGYLGNGLECHKWFSAGPDVAAYLHRQGEAKVSKPLDELDADDIDDDPSTSSLATDHQLDEEDEEEPAAAAELSNSKWEPLSLWESEQPQQAISSSSSAETNQVTTTATTADDRGWPPIEPASSLNTRTMFFQPPRFYGLKENVTTTTTAAASTTSTGNGLNSGDSHTTTESAEARSDTNEPVYIPRSSQPVSRQQDSRQTASTSTSTSTVAEFEPEASAEPAPSSTQPPTISPATYVTVAQQQQGSIQAANNNSPSLKRGTIIASATTSPTRGNKAALASSSTSSSYHKSKALGVTSAATAAIFSSLAARQDFQPILAIFSSLIIYHIVFTAFVLNH